MSTAVDRPFAGIEDPTTEDLAEVRRWVRIFSDLVDLDDQLIERTTRQLERQPDPALAARLGVLKKSRAELQARLDFWWRRLWEVRGLDLDRKRRTATYRSRSVALSGREFELLEFFLDHPGRSFTAEALAARAWHDPALAAEQVRSYIVRLRRRLTELSVPVVIRSRPGSGYTLVFTKPTA
jgi:hypothetical protein